MPKNITSNTISKMGPNDKLHAVIVGASGLIGEHLLQMLLASSKYTSVTALTRRPLNITHRKLVQVVIDFNQLNDELAKHCNKNAHQPFAEHIFCTLGSTINKAGSKQAFYQIDHDYPLAIAKYFHQQGASLFTFVSAIGANENSPYFYNQVKGEIENSLKMIAYPHLGIFRPSMLTGKRREFRLAEQLGTVLMKALAIVIPKKYRVISADKVATAMLKFANQPKQGTMIIESDQLQNH